MSAPEYCRVAKEEDNSQPMEQGEQKPNLFGLCRVATEEGEANAAWGGQWDAKEIMISMGAHATTDNLNNCPDFTVAFATKQTMVAADFVGIVSAKNDADKMAKTGWKCEKSEHVNAPVFTDFPMTLECRIKEKIDESEEGYYIVAEIVNILVDENYLAEDGTPDMEKMELIVFDPIHHGYIELGKTIGKAFSDGKALK